MTRITEKTRGPAPPATRMDQLRQIIDAVDADLDLVALVGRRCAMQVARDSQGRNDVIPFTRSVERRLAKAGRILLRIGGQDLLVSVVDKIVDRNNDDHQRRRILERVWNLERAKTARAS